MATPLGPIVRQRGLILQRGQFGSLVIRVGCIRDASWVEVKDAIPTAEPPLREPVTLAVRARLHVSS
jgi:hypothetical protein